MLTFKLIFSDCEPLTVFFPMFCDVIDFDINFDIDFFIQYLIWNVSLMYEP